MGVQGLQTYMLQNGSNLQRHRLCHCYLVIDAANLAHHLYHLHRIDYLFAGEYGQYARELRRAFSNLVECGLTPLFVLDGAKDWAGPKLREQRVRIERRVKKCVQLSRGCGARAKGSGDGNNRLLPVMAMDVFIATVVDEFKFHLIVSASGDADHHLASLAAQLNCPVLTNDSDFLIFDLPGGVILTKTLHLTKALLDDSDEQATGPFLDCQIYRVRDFYLPSLRRKVNPSLLPLCATLIGNDYLSRGVVGRCILSRVQLPKSAGGGGSQLKNSSRRLIAGMLIWTHKNFSQPEDCLAALRRLLLGGELEDNEKGDHKRWAHRFLASVQESMSHYNLQSSLTLESLDAPMPAEVDAAAEQDATVPTRLKFSKSLNLPDWLTDSGLLEGRTSLLFLDIAQHGQIYLPVGIEDPSQPCTFDDTAELRCLAYSMRLASIGRLAAQPVVVEHRRVGGSLKKSELTLPTWPSETRCRGCCDDAAGCLAAKLGYPGDPLSGAVSHAGLRIVLYSALASRRLLLANSSLPPRTCQSVCLALLASCLHRLAHCLATDESGADADSLKRQRATVLAKYAEPPVINHRIGYDLQLVHCISHFQATLLSANLLAQSHAPAALSLPSVSEYLSGRFLYNLANDVDSRKDGILFLSELLVRRSQLTAIFNQAVALI